MPKRPWTVRLTAAAAADFIQIVRWTRDHFGEAQALVYAETISLALEALREGPSAVGARARKDILEGLFSLHVARNGRKGRHFIMFRIGGEEAGEAIEVLRLLHDSMDLPSRLIDDTDAALSV